MQPNVVLALALALDSVTHVEGEATGEVDSTAAIYVSQKGPRAAISQSLSMTDRLNDSAA